MLSASAHTAPLRIGIVGAGAIGGWLAAPLASQGHALSVLTRGETLAALRAGPWRLTRDGQVQAAQVRASDAAAELGVQDIVLITLKAPALPQVAPHLSPLIGPDTLVIPAMNGVPWWFMLAGGSGLAPMQLDTVDPGGAIASALPFEQVIGCVVHASVSSQAPGHAVHKSGNRLILGEPSGSLTPRLAKVAQLFGDAGFDVTPSPRIREDVWYKLWGNMTVNPISALTGATADQILDDPLVSGLILRIMAETAALGARIGCEISERGEDRNQVTRQLGAFRTSMLQDVLAGRPIELDALLAAPREIAGRLGLATPDLDALFGLTRLFGRVSKLYPDADSAAGDQALEPTR